MSAFDWFCFAALLLVTYLCLVAWVWACTGFARGLVRRSFGVQGNRKERKAGL